MIAAILWFVVSGAVREVRRVHQKRIEPSIRRVRALCCKLRRVVHEISLRAEVAHVGDVMPRSSEALCGKRKSQLKMAVSGFFI